MEGEWARHATVAAVSSMLVADDPKLGQTLALEFLSAGATEGCWTILVP
ncbi:MAG: hypothetical protein KKI02_00565 [Planctomycetes bacterium]|nr:hypothetical protein [Planctomycetota bacterium]